MTQVTAVPVTADSELHSQVSDFYSRQMRLLGGPDVRAVVVLMGFVAGQLRGQLSRFPSRR